MSRSHFTKLVVVVAIIIAPTLAAGQTPKAGAQNTGDEQAASLRAQAVALYDDPARAAQVAKLHLEEVRHRSPTDPEAVHALFMAAFFFKTAGRLADARKTYEHAAERVLALGDVMAAAQAYLDAASMAQKAGNAGVTRRLASKAVLLAESPLLRADQQRWIRDQIQFTGGVATAVRY